MIVSRFDSQKTQLNLIMINMSINAFLHDDLTLKYQTQSPTLIHPCDIAKQHQVERHELCTDIFRYR